MRGLSLFLPSSGRSGCLGVRGLIWCKATPGSRSRLRGAFGAAGGRREVWCWLWGSLRLKIGKVKPQAGRREGGRAVMVVVPPWVVSETSCSSGQGAAASPDPAGAWRSVLPTWEQGSWSLRGLPSAAVAENITTFAETERPGCFPS